MEKVQDEKAGPGQVPERVGAIMFGLVLALFLANLDQTIVATSLTAIGHDFGHFDLLAWVITSYLVTSTATTPIYGRLSDRWGRRRLLLISIGVFVATSALCATAPNMPVLIGARALQGVGGGGLRSVSQIVIADIIPPRLRGKYQGYMSTAFLLSTTLGPVLGGLFAQHLSWRWSFWINLPLGGAAFCVVAIQLGRLALPKRKHRVDWLGAILILIAASAFMIGLSQVEELGWTAVPVVAPMSIGVLAAAALVGLELRIPEPMLPMRLFGNPIFSIGNVALFLPSMVMTALVILLPLYYQLVLQKTADEAGLRLILFTGAMAVGTYIVGSATSRLGRARIFPLSGAMISVASLILIARFGLGGNGAFEIIVMLALGLSIGAQINPLNVMIQNGLEVRDVGAGISGMTFFRALAGAVGVAIFMSYLIARLRAGSLHLSGHDILGSDPGAGLLRANLTQALPKAQAAAFILVRRQAFAACFNLAALVSLIGMAFSALLKDKPLRGSAAANRS